ncbi:Na+/H+ antiporter subunit E [Deinococcus arenicola]|uniref:Na+/H+ antiporter subunit E n=1 Tax=Deinococcus arenicola TaxID=2994950 RepID=A0ABU4DLH5_9DEIO|nr:Na+/H+ antiporter subunit E [Deinococcus sp. ZS9-10]MDV6373284.1 Na+/H+ antiporter subunit E [Deinococcus sp. ZS9-10]
MRGLSLNILLAIVWTLFVGEFSLRELAIGVLLGFAILSIFPLSLGTGGYVRRTLAVVRFALFFVRELTVANVQVALFALRPHPPLHPMIIAYPLRLHGDNAQTVLAATITLMPGSVAMGFNPERTVLYAHTIGLGSVQEARASLKKVEDALLPLYSQSAAASTSLEDTA